MKILHIPESYYPIIGGNQVHCQKVSEELSRQGHHVKVLISDAARCEPYYRTAFPQAASQEVINGVEIRRMGYGKGIYPFIAAAISKIPLRIARNFTNKVFWLMISALFSIDVYREIRSFRPDVVMTMPHLEHNVKAVFYARCITRFPLVMLPLLHENDPHFYSQWRIERAAKRATCVIAVTDHEADLLRTRYHVHPDKLFTIYVGVDRPNDAVVTEGPSNQVLFLGRLSILKNIADLLAAMKLVWEERPDAELILAGAKEHSTTEIEKWIREIPEKQRLQVRILKDISEEKKKELLQSCACLVLPSRIESFGIVILEAWSYGRPTITYDLPVFRSFIDPNKQGFLVKDIAEMADAILVSLNDPTLGEEMGHAGRKKAEQTFNWKQLALCYLKAYEYARKEFLMSFLKKPDKAGRPVQLN